MAEVTIESVAESVQKWESVDITAFNESNTPWSLVGNLNGTGGASNSVEEVLTWLGNEISAKSYELTTILKTAGIKLGVVLEHNPCL